MKDSSPTPDEKTRWAEERTDWAEDRTILANERTFAGWMRTGMASVAIAVGLRAIFGDAELGYAPARLVATLFIATAVVIFWTARRKSCETIARLSQHAASPLPTKNVTLVTAFLSLGAVATGVLLWLV